jgi:hypothetical protein
LYSGAAGRIRYIEILSVISSGVEPKPSDLEYSALTMYATISRIFVFYKKTATVMKYVTSRTLVPALGHGLSFIPLHYVHVTLTFSPRITSLYLNSLHFTLFISSASSFHLIYHFPNPFPKMTWFTGGSLKHLKVVGSRAVWSCLQRIIFRYVFLIFPS